MLFYSEKLQFEQERLVLEPGTNEEGLQKLGENALSIYISCQICKQLGGDLFLERVKGKEYQYVIEVPCTDIVSKIDHEIAVNKSSHSASEELLDQGASQIMLVTYDPIDMLAMKYQLS